jgi:septum formation protein
MNQSLEPKYLERFRLPLHLIERKPQVVLATRSPRRLELFKAYGLPFISQGADLPEEPFDGELPEDFARRLALEKAEAVARDFPGALVMGADTVVACEETILGKPEDEPDAERMLRMLSGRTHRVITGVALVMKDKDIRHVFIDITFVRFRPLSNRDIAGYIQSGEPLDKAGAYGIQGGAGKFVEHCGGSYTNVVGLPMEALHKALATMLNP